MNNGSPFLVSLNVQHEIVYLKKCLSLTLEFLRILMNFIKKRSQINSYVCKIFSLLFSFKIFLNFK